MSIYAPKPTPQSAGALLFDMLDECEDRDGKWPVDLFGAFGGYIESLGYTGMTNRRGCRCPASNAMRCGLLSLECICETGGQE